LTARVADVDLLERERDRRHSRPHCGEILASIDFGGKAHVPDVFTDGHGYSTPSAKDRE
jgi:hypothetical protein